VAAEKRIGCVAFDFDGTLVDSNPIKETGFVAVAKLRGIDAHLVENVLRRLPGGNRYQISAALAEALTASSTAAEKLAQDLADDYTRHCLTEVGSCLEVPGAKQTLTDLHAARLPMYVNSGTPQAALRPILKRRRIDEYFAGVLGGPQSKLDNLRAIALQTQLDPGEIMMVGDSDDDANAAAAFGCRFVGVTLRGNSRFAAPVAVTVMDLRGLGSSIRG